MAEDTYNSNGMPNPNNDQAGGQPMQSEEREGQQSDGFGAARSDQQFGSASGQSGGDSDLIDQVREDMTVTGPDGEDCGRVDSVEDGMIKLTRNDSADGQHHYLEAGLIEGIEGEEIRLSQTPDWLSSGESSRAM